MYCSEAHTFRHTCASHRHMGPLSFITDLLQFRVDYNRVPHFPHDASFVTIKAELAFFSVFPLLHLILHSLRYSHCLSCCASSFWSFSWAAGCVSSALALLASIASFCTFSWLYPLRPHLLLVRVFVSFSISLYSRRGIP